MTATNHDAFVIARVSKEMHVKSKAAAAFQETNLTEVVRAALLVLIEKSGLEKAA